MANWTATLLSENASLAEAISVLEGSPYKICLVTDDARKLMGTITDGDVRRAILRGHGLDASAATAMKTTPTTALVGQSPEVLRELMLQLDLSQIPLLDAQGRVVGLTTLKSLAHAGEPRDNWVVLMAGGLGNRLRPLTEDVPKPLLKVGRKPLLETILETFRSHEFRNFYISVNYKAEMIKAHFGDGEKWKCNIRYLEESDRLGTAGALGLIPEVPAQPLLIMNGDVLTNVDFSSLLEFHNEHRAKATMCVREFDFQVPYGVVNIDEHRITSVVEKPVHSFFVNAGIYVIEPELLKMVPNQASFDMPELFAKALEQKMATAAFPIREYWTDIGRIDDFHRANGDYASIFE
ncbi:Nucleoside-diphosphate-sugar pyrophosphorylase family protein [Rhodospirillaceae bacterium LM-1]|nr:Nucleoside-diphosphate-sugar pyrophosphorylase family protein [Rhodospirillaceae bacterium LM-1]